MRFDRDIFEEILITITRNRARSFLTAFGVFWGIFMLIALIGGGQGMQQMMQSQFEGFATNSGFIWPQQTGEPYKGFRKGRWWSMDIDDVARIKKLDEMDVVTPTITRWGKNAIFQEKKSNAIIKGLYPDYNKIEELGIIKGRLINDVDIREGRKVCVIGDRIYENLFEQDADPIGKYIQVDGIYYQVVGVSKSNGNMNIQGDNAESVIIPFTTMQKAYNVGRNIELLCFTVKPGVVVSEIQDKIEGVIKEAHLIAPNDKQAVMLLNTEAMFSMMDNLFTGIRILIWMVGLGTLLAGAIGVSNIMMVTVKERTTEIGIRRAIGARPQDILQQILSESIVLTTVAGMMGISFGVMVLQLAETILVAGRFNFQVSFGMAVGTCILLIYLGVRGGVAPAFTVPGNSALGARSDRIKLDSFFFLHPANNNKKK